jgi:hypothetical protein
MGDAAANDRALVSETGRGQAQVVVEIVQVGAADVTQLDVLEIGPDPFIRIELGRVARQLLETQPFGATVRQELLDRPAAMNRRAVPDDQQFAGQVAQEVTKELHHLWAAEGMILDLQQQPAAGRDPADDRQMVTGEWEAQRGRVSARSQAAHRGRQQGEAGLIYPHDRAALAESPLFKAGQRADRHCSIAASLRWLARRRGFCGLQPAARNRLPT